MTFRGGVNEKVTVDLALTPIGIIESCFKDRFAVPRQSLLVPSAWSRIKLYPHVQPELALQGLDGYSHLWVIFTFHLNTNERYHAKVHPPRLGGGTIGVFATRSPHRPNNIGLSLVEIKSVGRDEVEIWGADLVDGTPVYDIKPYLPSVESIPNAKEGWSGQAKDDLLNVEFASADLEGTIAKWATRIDRPVKEAIIQTLQRDPRPKVYKDAKSGQYRERHAFRLFDGDVHFYVNEGTATVTEILFAQKPTP